MIAANRPISQPEIDLDVFHRYAGLSLPRHVSYPMPTWWQRMNVDDAQTMYDRCDHQSPGYDLSLYVHIPFCERLCKFCGCNRVVLGTNHDKSRPQVDRYISALEKELSLLSKGFGIRRPLRQIHWGGGSPTYLDAAQIERVHQAIAHTFHIAPDAEISMEIDPRTASEEKMKTLRQLGFTRISMGVQDFDEQTQKHVRRVQPFEMVRDLTTLCRELGFSSINYDLIYGMPYQTPETIRATVKQTIKLSPDRIAFYHFAQIPDKIATQRGMDLSRLPSSDSKLDMFQIGLALFEAAGYDFIGLDHFAKPDESLAKSLADNKIQRNFQGMTTGGDLNLLGVGASSISQLRNIGFLQNIKDIDDYVIALESDRSPIDRGKWFTGDDCIRQAVLSDLYCMAELHPKSIESRFGIDFDKYFAHELRVMQELTTDGLVEIGADGVIRVTKPLGRVLMRNIAAVFDAYLDKQAYRLGEKANFSVNA